MGSDMCKRDRHNDGGMTVIIVTHEVDVAHFARRILRFQDGRVIKEEMNTERADAEKLLADFKPAEAA